MPAVARAGARGIGCHPASAAEMASAAAAAPAAAASDGPTEAEKEEGIAEVGWKLPAQWSDSTWRAFPSAAPVAGFSHLNHHSCSSRLQTTLRCCTGSVIRSHRRLSTTCTTSNVRRPALRSAFVCCAQRCAIAIKHARFLG
jgi:hypothetical protein